MVGGVGTSFHTPRYPVLIVSDSFFRKFYPKVHMEGSLHHGIQMIRHRKLFWEDSPLTRQQGLSAITHSQSTPPFVRCE